MKVIPLDHRFENDTCYVADRAVYEIDRSGTILADEPQYHEKHYTEPLPTAFYLRGLRNVTLDFGGAVLSLRGKLQPFLLDGCEHVTIRNVTIRYDRSPYTQGTVVEADEAHLALSVPAAFPCRTEDGNLVITSDTWENNTLDKAPMFLQFFDGETRQGAGLCLAIFGKNPQIDPSLPWAKSTVRLTAHQENGLLVLRRTGGGCLPNVKIGQYAVIGHETRRLSGLRIVCSSDVCLENVRILNGFGMGVYPFHCRNLTIDGLRMTCDEQSPGIIANAADGIHAFACSGDFIIRNTLIEGTIDDALNIHSNFYTVLSASGRTITARTGLYPAAETPMYLPGDRIRVYRGFTMEPAAEYTLTAVRPVGNQLVEFTLDQAVSAAHAEKDVIENLSTQCRLTITNSKFRKTNTHLRFQTRGGVLIEDCETELPFLLTGDMTYWFESSPCERFTVRRTAFTRPQASLRVTPEFVSTPSAPYYHGDLLLEDCSFVSERPVDAAYTRSLTMTGCKNAQGLAMTARLTNCGEARLEGCAVERVTEENHVLKCN